MSRIRKFLIRSAIVVLILGLAAVAYIFFFLQSTEAPVTKGQVEFHVPYKHEPLGDELTLDIYHPTSSTELEQYPVLMYVHGGAWITGSKLTVNNNRFNEAFNVLREAGYFVISPDYTLADNDETPFPDCIQDIYAAVRWVEENADAYHFDLSRFGFLGESAGAHLAMMTTFSTPQEFDLSYTAPEVRFLIDIYGPTDLSALYYSDNTDSINELISRLPTALAERLDLSRLLIGFKPEEQPEIADSIMRYLSPTTYIDKEDIPLLIIHGTADQIVPVEQSYILATLLDSLKYPYEAHYFPGINHAFQGATDSQKTNIQELIIQFAQEKNQ